MNKNAGSRSYWMSDDNWYRINEGGKFELTDAAPPEARRSFEEWHMKPKMSLWRRLRRLRTLFW